MMNVNLKRTKKVRSAIALLLALAMMLLPLSVFADSGDGGEVSDTSTTTSSSSESTSSSDSSTTTSSTGSSSTESSGSTSSYGNESSTTAKTTSDSSSSEETGDNSGSTGSSETGSNETGTDKSNNEDSISSEESPNEQKETDENTEKESAVYESGTDESAGEDEVSPVFKSTDESSSQESGNGSEDGKTAEDEEVSANTYSVVVNHVDPPTGEDPYPAEYEAYLGLDEIRYFEAAITEIGYSTIGSVQLTVPDGFELQGDYLTWSFSSINGGFDAGDYKDNWDYSLDTGAGTLSFWAKHADYYLIFGETLTTLFKARTPITIDAGDEKYTYEDGDSNTVTNENIGIYRFGVQAWTDVTFDGGGNGIGVGTTPNYRFGEQVKDADGNVVGLLTGSDLDEADVYSQTKVWVLDDEAYVGNSEGIIVTGPNADPNNSDWQGPVEYNADLVVTPSGADFVFSLTLNLSKQGAWGNNKVNEIVIEIPAGISITEFIPSGGWTLSGNTLTWLGEINADGSISVSFNGAFTNSNPHIFWTEVWEHNTHGVNAGRVSKPYKMLSDEVEEVANPLPLPQLPLFTYLEQPTEPVGDGPGNGGGEDPGNGGGEEPGGGGGPGDDPDPGTVVLPEVIAGPGPVTPLALPEAPAEELLVTLALPPAAPEIVPDEAEAEEAPIETMVIAQEEPQVEPAVERVLNLWPLLLLLIPGLIWFLLARLVLVRVPDEEGKFKTVARKIARRRDKRWFVDVEKQLAEYLDKHAEVLVDFRGGLIKDAKKAVYTEDTVLSEGEKRFALINRQRVTIWLDEIKERSARVA